MPSLGAFAQIIKIYDTKKVEENFSEGNMHQITSPKT